MQDIQYKETSTDEVQSTREYKKITIWTTDFSVFRNVLAGFSAHPGLSCTVAGTVFQE
jgi:hypothetical protein